MSFTEWTYEAVRERIIEMASTLRLLPKDNGPKQFGNNMPDIVRRYDESYGFDRTRVRVLPTSHQLSRMEECFGWINEHLDEKSRKLIYDYSFIKVRRGQLIDRYLRENDIARRTFERQVRKACQQIADNLNRLYHFRLTIALDGLSQNHVDLPASSVTSEKRANHWMTPDAKPQIDPDLPKERLIRTRR